MAKAKKRVVVKISSSVLARHSASPIQDSPLRAIVDQVCSLQSEGFEFLLVTSGAIGAGAKKLKWAARPQDIRKKQAAAAVGQVALMDTYRELFERHGVVVAQVLLTRGDFVDRQRYLNARHTLAALLELGAVPVINENDTVATEEIQFGDNDSLSALVAAKIDADVLVLLSDVDGLLRGAGKAAEVVPVVSEITPEIERLVWKGAKSATGTGGMASKIEAARIATASGVTVFIANAFREGAVADILEGRSVGTKFVPLKSLSAKERWILFGAIPKGEIVVDVGAARALTELHKSLLPAGVTGVSGNFARGEVVKIKGGDGRDLARGIASFSSEEIAMIQGKRSGEIKTVLKSAANSSEVVHRDALVLLG